MPVSARRSVGALLAAVALTLLTPPAPAQDGTDLTLGQALPGSLVSGSVDFYTLELPEGHFVFGRVEQVSCDDLAHGVPFTIDTPRQHRIHVEAVHGVRHRAAGGAGRAVARRRRPRAHPRAPDFGRTVTLRHLLTHTSGYREFLNTLALGGRRIDTGDHVDRGEIIEIVRRQPELQNEPGRRVELQQHRVLAARPVVERVTETPFPGWMRENVFEPLGMRAPWSGRARVIVVRRPGVRAREDGGYREGPDLGGAMGAGGIYTTVGDLARWIGTGTGSLSTSFAG
jgi:hypothetical protein